MTGPPKHASQSQSKNAADIAALAWMRARGMPVKYDNISAEERTQVEELFELIDEDGGGDIGVDEVGAALRFCGLAPTVAQLDELFGEIDSDGSGRVDVDEFTTMLLDPKMHAKVDELAIAGALMPVPLWMITYRRRAMITEIATSEAHGGNAGTVMFGPGATRAPPRARARRRGRAGRAARLAARAASNPEYSAKRRPQTKMQLRAAHRVRRHKPWEVKLDNHEASRQPAARPPPPHRRNRRGRDRGRVHRHTRVVARRVRRHRRGHSRGAAGGPPFASASFVSPGRARSRPPARRRRARAPARSPGIGRARRAAGGRCCRRAGDACHCARSRASSTRPRASSPNAARPPRAEGIEDPDVVAARAAHALAAADAARAARRRAAAARARRPRVRRGRVRSAARRQDARALRAARGRARPARRARGRARAPAALAHAQCEGIGRRCSFRSFPLRGFDPWTKPNRPPGAWCRWSPAPAKVAPRNLCTLPMPRP